MSETWYRVWRYGTTIHPVDVLKATDKTLLLTAGWKVLISSKGGIYFPTLDEAEAYVAEVKAQQNEKERRKRLADAAPELLAALKLALEYWAHRQQRYKNRHPVWIIKARSAIALAEGGEG